MSGNAKGPNINTLLLLLLNAVTIVAGFFLVEVFHDVKSNNNILIRVQANQDGVMVRLPKVEGEVSEIKNQQVRQGDAIEEVRGDIIDVKGRVSDLERKTK